MVRPRNETENLLLSMFKSCQTLIKQHRENHKKHLNLCLPKQEEQLCSNHQSQMKETQFRVNYNRRF